MTATQGEVLAATRSDLFPDALLTWAGHRDGGVRKPFRRDSGRPAGGKRIDTPLLSRLNSWVDSLLNPEVDTPRVVLLVGGPGNGKTDAVESTIEFLDDRLGLSGALVDNFARQFNVGPDTPPPRTARLNLGSAFPGIPAHLKCQLRLVQDATEDTGETSHSKEDLLLEDLKSVMETAQSDIYLCCVNRGVLAQTANVAHKRFPETDLARLLDRITESTASVPGAPSCWPLAGFEHIAVWPMDVESLVDTSTAGQGSTVAHQIFHIALEEDAWRPRCPSGPRCPFCQNRRLLAARGAVDSLILALRYYEIGSGKRWSFRDLFSLVSYLLVGEYSEFQVEGETLSPCEWAARQLRLCQTGNQSDVAVARAPYLLASKLYYHRLFPVWPRFTQGSFFAAKRAVFKKDLIEPDLQSAWNLFRYLASQDAQSELESGEVPRRVFGSLAPMLDPGLVSGAVKLSDGGLTAREIEEAFSLSVAEGLMLVDSKLEPLDRDILKRLSVADDALTEERFPPTKGQQVWLLRSTIRQYCARLTKRCIGTRSGVFLNAEEFDRYQQAMREPEKLKEIARQLRSLLHDDKNQFSAQLMTTFGQPVAQRSREVTLVTEAIKVRALIRAENQARPREPMPYLRVEDMDVAVTFAFFDALERVSRGLNPASLPEEIFALLNGIRSFVSGDVVRDGDRLAEGAVIQFGGGRRQLDPSQLLAPPRENP
jgi:hypothetical protein